MSIIKELETIIMESNNWTVDELIAAFQKGLAEVREEIGDVYVAGIWHDRSCRIGGRNLFAKIEMPAHSTSPARILGKYLKPFSSDTMHSRDGPDKTWRWLLSRELTPAELDKAQDADYNK